MTYTTLDYTVRFLTPAFLGNAEQTAQWRTPPFKALLRQWWRVAYAQERQFNVDIAAMRREEGALFGNAWLSHREAGRTVHDHSKSQIRLRLTTGEDQRSLAWSQGSQSGVSPLKTDISTGHAWFGLVKRGKGLSDRSGIQAAGSEAVRHLRLAVPEQCRRDVERACTLIHHFGQLGSRSRGGWGSLSMTSENAASSPRPDQLDYLNWRQCLQAEWPQAIAQSDDGRPWLWTSQRSFRDWPAAMAYVAAERRTVRTALKDLQFRDLRFALGFAQGDKRAASPLRWRITEDPEGALRVRVFAMPHAQPALCGQPLSPTDLETAWAKVAEVLDGAQALARQQSPTP